MDIRFDAPGSRPIPLARERANSSRALHARVPSFHVLARAHERVRLASVALCFGARVVAHETL